MVKSSLFPTYNRFDVSVASAEGVHVTDTEGKVYLDFGSGIGVNNLGHRHPDVQQAIEKQLNDYWHVSNLYSQPIQESVAQLITNNSVGENVFFCNSGAEANEAAIKLARKATGKAKIITFKQSFHGRTFATMAATGQSVIHDGFGPKLEEFQYVPFNDLAAVEAAVDNKTAAIMLEVIQGEGGVVPGEKAFIKGVEAICREHNILLIVDEIQTGIGRTGKLFGYMHYDISPDIFTLAKGLGNGLPVGAMVAKGHLKGAFHAGTHGSTFGGNPIAMAASEAVLKHVTDEAFLEEIVNISDYTFNQLKTALAELEVVVNIRGEGLMIGIECREDVGPFIPELLNKGIIVLNAGPKVLRLLPPLTIKQSNVDELVSALQQVLTNKK